MPDLQIWHPITEIDIAITVEFVIKSSLLSVCR